MTVSRLESLESLLRQEPNDSFIRYAMALEYLSRNEVDRGIEYLEEVLRRDPAYVAAYQQLGQALARQGRGDAAAAVYRKGIDIASNAGDRHAADEMRIELEALLEEE